LPFQKLNVNTEEKNKNGIYTPTFLKFNVDACKILKPGTAIRNPLIHKLQVIARRFGKFPWSCPIKKVLIAI
jgi:hypothetical protein